MALSVTEIVVEFLQDRKDQKFTAREIAEWIFKTYPDECRKKQATSKAKIVPLDSDTAFLQQLVSEVGSAAETGKKAIQR